MRQFLAVFPTQDPAENQIKGPIRAFSSVNLGSGVCRATYDLGSTESQAAWRSVGQLDESRRLFTNGASLQIPLELLPEVPLTTAKQSLISPGIFARAYGPLASDMILAFTANGEAHWFRNRRREGA